MFKDADGDKEILLGNKQLLGIFFLLAILFGVFFTAGYMVGRSAAEKKQAASITDLKTPAQEPAPAQAGTGETHAVTPDVAPAGETHTAASPTETQAVGRLTREKPAEQPLGARKTKKPTPADRSEQTRDALEQEPAAAASASVTAPVSHATYLQVAALGRTEAEAVAKVLSKKGFQTHVAPKPGTQYFRVLVGPVRDAGELNSTRDALKSKGFREVFVQHL